MDPFCSPEEKHQVAKNIKKTCIEIGFFYVKVQHIPNSELDRIISLIRELFPPLSERNKIKHYECPGIKTLQNLNLWPIAATELIKFKEGGEEVLVRCGTHTDYGSVTLLLTDPTQGPLKVLTKNNQWIKADPIPGAFVVNIGNIIERRTNGLWRNTGHRVIHEGDGFRVSVPLFYKPSFNAIVKKEWQLRRVWARDWISCSMARLSAKKSIR
jgi:isopenicillin N synthase-like dioxygenase